MSKENLWFEIESESVVKIQMRRCCSRNVWCDNLTNPWPPAVSLKKIHCTVINKPAASIVITTASWNGKQWRLVNACLSISVARHFRYACFWFSAAKTCPDTLANERSAIIGRFW